MDETQHKTIRGRGAAHNPPARFDRLQIEPDAEDRDRPGPRTEILVDHSRTILTRNDSPDIPFTYSINPYRGCEHGCSYCYARPTHEYLGLSAGVDFETKIFAKVEAAALLRKELLSRSWKPEVVSISGVTDPYQPVERKLKLTRACLEVLREFGNPFTLVTKNHLITRDTDILAEMAGKRAAAAFITITTLDASLSEKLEPRASRPSFRLEAVRTLADHGVPVGIMIAPVIPGLTDHEIPSILAEAARAGARHAGFVPLRLPGAVAPIFEDWLTRNFPDRRDKILHRVRAMRGGKLNDPRFKSRMRGEGEYAEQIRAVFKLYARREGLNGQELDLSVAEFRRPENQLSFL
ncbi:MAG TPA: PA0069 family radical SAM protein [Bdellovibrionota bacterium]|nr:PA0069 family radical SAM protein [Bdellovibrionota bacterium]